MKQLLFQLLLFLTCLAISKTSVSADIKDSEYILMPPASKCFNTSVGFKAVTDTIPDDASEEDSATLYTVDPAAFRFNYDTVNTRFMQLVPNITVQQIVKGAASGLYVQETTGEPGSVHQNMYIRGLSRPLLSPKELYLSQPAVYLNGVPLVKSNPYIYNTQTYDVNPIGSATDLLSILDQDNIEKIDVVKDFKDIGILGPRAANGAIYITTKNAEPGEKRLSINGYYGYAPAPVVNTINAATEKDFRLPFYHQYGNQSSLESLPGYLSDSSNGDYYGPSNWTDLYYKDVPLYNVNASLTGGAGSANFRAFFGTTQNANAADATGIKRYNGSFYISMLPTKWLTVSTMISGTILNRSRNRSFTDRFAEMRYIPSVANPLPPNKKVYQQYVDVYEGDLIDDNLTSSVQGYFSASATFGKFVNTARLSFDYGEDKRDVFYPKILFSGNNYVSNFFGFNQRFMLEDHIKYTHLFDNLTELNLMAGLNYQSDVSRYNYFTGYNGPDDVKRIAEVEGATNKTNYLIHDGYLVNGYLDKVQQRLMSFWGAARYKLNNGLEFGALLRSDGSSSMQPNSRWFVSPVFDVKYDVVKKSSSIFSAMDLHASWGIVGDLVSDQLIGAGPQYSPQLSWNGSLLTSFNGYGTYSRPYNDAWIGYDIPWSYAQQLNVGTQMSLLNNKISIRLDVYNKDNKNLTITMPTTAESGYEYELRPGMWVNNKGIDATLGVAILAADKNRIGWTASLNGTYNKNTLKALPGNVESIVLHNRKLQVGYGVDQFWLLQNEGIYSSQSQIPDGLNYKGLPISVGDPKWKDTDGNNVINDNDKVLKGNSMPKLFGGFINQLTYKGFDLNFHIQYAAGHSVINQEASNYLDFITRDNSNSLNSVKEITYWEDRVETENYPLYNPWSTVAAYQVNQDLFLEKADYLSLRSATIGYKITGKNQIGFGKAKGIRDLYIYVTGTNLLRFSAYSGRNSELANYYGYDNGLSLPLAKSVILGIKLNL